MKLKKGFTLVEMLAVVVLIGILVVITVPSIKTIMNNAKEKSLERQIASIIESTKGWSIENVDELPDNNVPILVSLSELKEQGFLEDKEIINPVNNKEITGCIEIKYDLDFNQYKYNYKEDCELEMPDEILISSISLNTTSVSVINGGTYQIEASISPSSATNKNLKYTSNNESIVSVSSTGLITGISGGETTITVSTQDGSNISKVIEVIVREQITNITLSETSIEINKGQSKIVTATITPTNAFNKTLKWESEDENIATVNNGVITGVNVGTAKVTVSTTDGSNITKEINVKVNSIMTSTHTCVTNTNTICSSTDIKNGILVNVRVNDNEDYDFYVVSDTGSELTLIMDRNIGNKVAWASKNDYNDDTNYGSSGNNNKGPITVLNYLNSQTEGWTNIPAIESYKYDNNLNGTTNIYGYQKLEITNGKGLLTSQDGNTKTELTGISRARLLTYEEATAFGCKTYVSDGSANNSCQSWLYTNLYTSANTSLPYGYWLLTTNPSSSTSARYLHCYGSIDNSVVYNGASNVTRPVIKIKK